MNDIPDWHRLPVYPRSHEHEKLCMEFIQVAPFRHVTL